MKLDYSLNRLISSINSKYGFDLYNNDFDLKSKNKYILKFQESVVDNIDYSYEKYIIYLPYAIKEYINCDDVYVSDYIIEFINLNYKRINSDGIIVELEEVVNSYFNYITEDFIIVDYYLKDSAKFTQLVTNLLISDNLNDIAKKWLFNASKCETIERAVWLCELYRELNSFSLYSDVKYTQYNSIREIKNKIFGNSKIINSIFNYIINAYKKGIIPDKYYNYLMKSLKKPGRDNSSLTT